MKKRHINTELIEKLAGYGPNCTEQPTEANLARLADPRVSLAKRICLLEDIIGGSVHYEEVASMLDEDRSKVFAASLLPVLVSAVFMQSDEQQEYKMAA